MSRDRLRVQILLEFNARKCGLYRGRLAAPAGPQETATLGLDPKLRSFTPALIAYAEQGNADKAFEGARRHAAVAGPCHHGTQTYGQRQRGSACHACSLVVFALAPPAGGGGRLRNACLPRLLACLSKTLAFPVSKVAPRLPCSLATRSVPPCLPAVDTAIAAQQLDLTEPEFARLLQAATSGACWERAASVLRRIGAELTVLQPETLRRVAALFASPAAAADAGGAWELAPTTVSPTGQCSACGGQLKALDLSAQEMRTFAEGIAAIAERQEKRSNDFQQVRRQAAALAAGACSRHVPGAAHPGFFIKGLFMGALTGSCKRWAEHRCPQELWQVLCIQLHPPPPPPSPPPTHSHPHTHRPQFKEWLTRHGPFGAVVDGANVALFGQNFESGGFNFGQIK